jgi:hypothetical protein
MNKHASMVTAMLRALKQLFGAPYIERIPLHRSDLSARDAWEIVAPHVHAADASLLLVGVINSLGPLRPTEGIRPSMLQNGRIADDTAWEFLVRSPDGDRQIRFTLSGDGTLQRRKQRITVFAVDDDGDRIRPRAISGGWVDSPEISNIVRGTAPFQSGLSRHDLSSISLEMGEWFPRRQSCWIARCRFGDARRGARTLTVLDAISGAVLSEELTRYADGVPISTSAST